MKHSNMLDKLTPWAPSGKPPGFGIDPSNGLFAGDGARAPFGCPQEWSTKRVLISGLGLGFLQSWCCQFKLSKTNTSKVAYRKIHIHTA
jgi:hypothetical protein